MELTISTFHVQKIQSGREDAIVAYDDFCGLKNTLIASTSRGSLAIAARGKCSFIEKARNAQKLGYKALLLVNSEDDLFVVGGSDDNRNEYVFGGN